MAEVYVFKVPYEGYSRGDAIMKVEADSKEEALEIVKNGGGYLDYLEPIRDDTDKDFEEAEEY